MPTDLKELYGVNPSVYYLRNAHIPSCFLEIQGQSEISQVDLKIVKGKIVQITPSNGENTEDIISYDLAKKLVFPCFADLHTHLDRGHIWERSPNSNGTFAGAIDAVINDKQEHWRSDDVYRRLEFGLKCSYAHGSQAIRTHIDATGPKGLATFKVFEQLRQNWSDRLELQAASLVSLDYYQSPEGLALVEHMNEQGHILGGVAYMAVDLEENLDFLFKIAKQRGMKIDLHVDENGDPNSRALEKVALAALKHDYLGQVVCGHCCSLSVQNTETSTRIIELVKQAGISIVSLPMCNMFLQDRKENTTPFWRGITRVHELQLQDISVCFASDNCRDPFYGYGDNDMLDVLSQSVKIAHLDKPYANWFKSVTSTPSRLMGVSSGMIAINSTADLIIFSARYFSELFSRPQHDRLVLRSGKAIDTVLPSYSELDDLIFSWI